MIKKIIPALFVLFTMASCSSMKPLNSINSKQAAASPAASTTRATNNKGPKFLDDISVNTESGGINKKGNTSGKASANESNINAYLNRSPSLEKASAIQLKYAILLNTEVEQLQNNSLLEHVDEWYGTRYRYGGTTKSGIDCSAFVQAVYLSAFSISLPRTAREQYRSSRIISATEIKEGDLVFFNTTGGVSHVGIYLLNNKFIHASTSLGVTVSDMFDPFYLKRFIGAGRIEKPEAKIK